MTFAADGKTVFSMDSDEVRTWDAGTGKEIRRLALPRGTLTRSLHPVALSPDGKRLAEGRYTQGLRLIDAENGKELQWFRKIGYRVDNRCVLSFSPGGKTLAVFDPLGPGSVYLVEAATAKLAHTLKLPGEPMRGLRLSSPAAVFSPDCQRLAVPLQRSGVAVYETATGKEVRLLDLGKGTRFGRHARESAFGPDGKRLAVELNDGTAAVFDLGSGKVILTVG